MMIFKKEELIAKIAESVLDRIYIDLEGNVNNASSRDIVDQIVQLEIKRQLEDFTLVHTSSILD